MRKKQKKWRPRARVRVEVSRGRRRELKRPQGYAPEKETASRNARIHCKSSGCGHVWGGLVTSSLVCASGLVFSFRVGVEVSRARLRESKRPQGYAPEITEKQRK